MNNQSRSSRASQSSSSVDQEDAANPLAPELVDLAVAELRYQTAFYLEVIQAMSDGVTLGAEQVQDERLEVLEQGPYVDLKEEIFLFVLTIILEGPVGTAIAAAATRAFLRPVMRMMGRAITLQARREVAALRSEIRVLRGRSQDASRQSQFVRKLGVDFDSMVKPLEESVKKLGTDLRGKKEATTQVRKTLEKVTNAVQDNLVPVVKGAKAVQDIPDSSGQLGGGGSLGVEVQAAAMASASQMRLTVIATHEALEAELKRSDITLGEVTKILDDYRLDEELRLAEVRSAYQLATEAMIWAKLLINQQKVDEVQSRARRSTLLRAEVENGLFPNYQLPIGVLHEPYIELDASEKIVKYLLIRFDRELERWVLEENRTIPILEARSSVGGLYSPRPTGWWQKLVLNDKQDFVVQYLVEVATNTPRELQIRG